MRKRLMASTAAIIIVGFLVAFALAAKLVQDQYQLEFTRRLDSITRLPKRMKNSACSMRK